MSLQVVFIHLGKSSVDHLWLNLSRHKSLFPNIEVTVILDFEGHLKNVPIGINIYLFKRSDLFLNENRFNSHDQKFRRGFWRYSLERIFAIVEYHEQMKLDQPLLHVESDVLLMPNFPWTFLASQDRLFWNIYNSDRDVSALLFSPNKNSSYQFLQQVKSALSENPAHTDMTVLSKVREHNRDIVQVFPALPRTIPELENPVSLDENAIETAYSKLTWPKDGIFDGAAIGMWLCGHDPRNNYGNAIIHDSSPIVSGDSIIDPSSINYELNDDGSLNLISPFTNSSVPLWSLHVHAKSLEMFGEKWIYELSKYVELSWNKEQMPIFRLGALKNMLVESVKGRTLLRFLIGFPHVHALRRRFSPMKRRILAKYQLLKNLARK